MRHQVYFNADYLNVQCYRIESILQLIL